MFPIESTVEKKAKPRLQNGRSGPSRVPGDVFCDHLKASSRSTIGKAISQFRELAHLLTPDLVTLARARIRRLPHTTGSVFVLRSILDLMSRTIET
jgi:hypothetical protein